MASKIAVTALRSLRPSTAVGSAGWMWFLLLLALVWLFSPGLFWSEVPAFRDAYYFYYPQAVWLDRCAEQGNLFPVWNPAEGLGSSVAGQPSAALFYPLRIAWLIPGLSVAQRFALFTITHLLIAAAGMRYAAAQLKLSDQAGWLAAVSFCLSCPVFFQHTNPIYLYSAAWIGFAAGALLPAVRQLRWPCSGTVQWRGLVIFASACSLMLLAGDPHTAVNTLIVGGCLQLATSIAPVCRSHGSRWQRWRQLLCRTTAVCLWLLSAGLLVTALTAIQWIPAWRQAQASARAAQAAVVPTGLATAEPTAAVGLERVNEIIKTGQLPQHRVYDFSLAPWYLATAVWPTLGGDYLPQNSRLFAVIPGEGRMWIPSLYFGCLPCGLVLVGLTRKKSRLTKCLLAVAAVALLAAWGSYSTVWFVRELLNALGLHAWANRLPPDPTSGLYWLMCTVLPAYDLFRYPAKWTVWCVAACSLLAAGQLSKHDPHQFLFGSQRLIRVVQIVSAVGLCAALALWVWAMQSPVNTTGLDRWLARAAPDAWLGPPHARAIGQSLMVAFAVPWLILSINLAKRFYALITLAEMTLVASCWVSFVPPPAVGDDLALPPAERGLENIFIWADRSQADLLTDLPSVAMSTGPTEFVQAQASYQQAFWLGKLSSITEIRCLSAAQSIEAVSQAKLRTRLSQQDRLTRWQPELDAVLRELGVTHRLVRQRLPGAAAQFAWQPIENTRPQCELLGSDGWPTNQAASLPWQWRDSDAFDVILPDASAGQLLIRQFNDGGWAAHADDGAEIAVEPENLFILLSLQGDERRVRLTRKWLW